MFSVTQGEPGWGRLRGLWIHPLRDRRPPGDSQAGSEQACCGELITHYLQGCLPKASPEVPVELLSSVSPSLPYLLHYLTEQGKYASLEVAGVGHTLEMLCPHHFIIRSVP